MSDLAELLDVRSSTIQYFSERDTIPLRHYQKLVAFGIPADILPEPKDLISGPRRKPGPKPAVPSAVRPARQPERPH